MRVVGIGKLPPNVLSDRKSALDGVIPDVKKIIDNLGREGRISFMLPQVPADTPPVNVHTYVKSIKLYGKYPIPENLDEIVFEPPELEPYHDWREREIAEGQLVDYE